MLIYKSDQCVSFLKKIYLYYIFLINFIPINQTIIHIVIITQLMIKIRGIYSK